MNLLLAKSSGEGVEGEQKRRMVAVEQEALGLSFNPALNGLMTSVPSVTQCDLHNTGQSQLFTVLT